MWIVQARVRRSVEATQPAPGVQLESEEDEVKKLLHVLDGELKELLDAVEDG
jgi:hypothetical protein